MQHILKYLKNHQLLQFAVIGGFIFLLFKFTASSDRPEIVVTQTMISDLLDYKSEITGHQLNETEKQEAINNYIDEEVLLREAYNQGLDRNDSKIRERLVDKMRFLMSKELDEPSKDTLIAFYNDHLDLYSKPEYITFDQVYFKHKENQPNKNDFLNKLKNTEDFEKLGDSLWLGSHLKGYANTDLRIIFGEDFTSELFKIENSDWNGPLKSEHGSHYVRVLEKVEPDAYPYENVKSFVREDWSVFQSQATLKGQMDDLKKSYKIRILEDIDKNE